MEVFSFEGPNGWNIHTRHWKPENPKGTVFGVHGYSEHGGCYEHLAEYLCSHGYEVFFCDLPGHGESCGKRNNIDHFPDYVDTIHSYVMEGKKRGAKAPFHLFAHSLGGLVAIRFVQTAPIAQEFESLSLSGPLLGIYGFKGLKAIGMTALAKILPNLTIPNESNLGLDALTHDKEMQKKRLADPLIKSQVTINWLRESLEAMKRAFQDVGKIRMPVGLFQGEEEVVTNRLKAKEFLDLLKTETDYKLYQGFRHEIVNEIGREKVFEDLLAWFDKHSASGLSESQSA